MTVSEAAKVRLTFGKHKGQPLDDVPLRYLDWLLGQDWLFPDLREAITVYLSSPAIARELETELGDDE